MNLSEEASINIIGMMFETYTHACQSTSDTEVPFLDLHLSISTGFLPSENDKHKDCDFDIVNCPFLDGDVPCSTSYGVYISQLIRFARVTNHVADFNARNKSLTSKLLQQGYQYHKLRDLQVSVATRFCRVLIFASS